MTFYANKGDCNLFHLVSMETEFLRLINYNLFVDSKKFNEYLKYIVSLKGQNQKYIEY
jgi:hypothetical protein